jgi:hypothetical protein
MIDSILSRIPGADRLGREERSFLEKAFLDPRLDPVWRSFAVRPLAEVMLLAGRAGPLRLRLEFIEICAAAVRLIVAMKVPVPVRAGDGPVEISEQALLAVSYPREAMIHALPGLGVVQVLSPLGIFHPNIGGPGQQICLGASLPARIRLSELIFMCYGALSLQSVNFDAMDPLGVMNGAAAEWWGRNRSQVPLTRASLLSS